MTGYALKTVEFEDYTVHCEIKSLNNKFLEVKLRLPPYMPEIENSLRKYMKASIKRGKVEVYIRVEVKERTEFEIIKSLLRKYYGIVREIEEDADFHLQVSVSELLGMKNILGHHEEYSYIDLPSERIVEVFEQTLLLFNESRYIEGENTKMDITQYIGTIMKSLKKIEKTCPAIVERYKSQIKQRIQELLDDKVDETRLMIEVGIFASKVDISEEISRINSHVKRALGLIERNESCGRELDFIIQELHREINTIGSKVGDYAVSDEVINIKTMLEKIKEQVRNIE